MKTNICLLFATFVLILGLYTIFDLSQDIGRIYQCSELTNATPADVKAICKRVHK